MTFHERTRLGGLAWLTAPARAIVVSFGAGALSLGLSACATGDAPVDANDAGDPTAQSGDASVGDAPSSPGDGGSTACPTGRAGPGCTACADGFHSCATDCVQAMANVPEAGCAAGCGAACSDPANGAAVCSEAGACDFACSPTYERSDAGCACPAGLRACSTGCAQCCGDSDCPNHTTCSAGTCRGCTANWGDCDSNPGNGCETDLSQGGNCGSCGNSCCGSFCGCGFLGTGGKSCKPSGTAYSCQC